jgi:hypothetical protein
VDRGVVAQQIDVLAVDFRSKRADQRVFGFNHIAVRFERRPNRVAHRGVIDSDDDVLRGRAGRQRFLERTVDFLGVMRLGEGWSSANAEKEQRDGSRA